MTTFGASRCVALALALGLSRDQHSAELHGVATILFGTVCREVVWRFAGGGDGGRGSGSHPVHTEAVSGTIYQLEHMTDKKQFSKLFIP